MNKAKVTDFLKECKKEILISATLITAAGIAVFKKLMRNKNLGRIDMVGGNNGKLNEGCIKNAHGESEDFDPSMVNTIAE